MPISAAEFLDVFSRYHAAVWPAPVLLVALALFVLQAAARERPAGVHLAIRLILAFMWFWAGIVYHIGFLRDVNPAAVVFGALFVMQGIAVAVSPLRLRLSLDARSITGLALAVFALAGYPLLSFAAGHAYPGMPTFGLPCPLVIFTLGVLLWARPAAPLRLFIIPLAWSIVGTSAAVLLAMHEDFSLAAAAAIAAITLFALRHQRHLHQPGVAT